MKKIIEYFNDCLEYRNVVNRFVSLMELKFGEKNRDGYTGWDDPKNKDMILRKLKKNLDDGDYVDVGNLVVMLWSLDIDSRFIPDKK